MKGTVSRKTYYLLGLVAAGCIMAGDFLALAGEPVAPLESLAFALTGLMFLFLAAVKGSPAREKQRYFLCFLLTMVANVQLTEGALINQILLAFPWPALGWAEQRRGKPVDRQLRVLALAEALAATVRVAVSGGLWGFAQNGWLYYVLEILACAARGWLIMTLIRLENADQGVKGEK